jgi:hypothetical protein
VQELTAEAEVSMASAQGDDQLSTLIAEREAWIEEVQAQRAEATGESWGGALVSVEFG